jgi:hypothetical protein
MPTSFVVLWQERQNLLRGLEKQSKEFYDGKVLILSHWKAMVKHHHIHACPEKHVWSDL